METTEKQRRTLSISYNPTEDNEATREKFTNFALEETDNVYILALKKLLEEYELAQELKNFSVAFAELNRRVTALEEIVTPKKQTEEKEKRVIKTFGGE